MTENRDHDVVLFGATGFTGALTAEYLAPTPPKERAGRSRGGAARSSRRFASASRKSSRGVPSCRCCAPT